MRRDVTLERIEDVYRSSFPKFVRVAQTIVGDPDTARDAVQDGFADAVRGRRTFRGDAPLEAWVWRCVINAARKLTREPSANGDVPEGAAAAEGSLLAASPLVSGLPERQRLAVYLRYYAELDYRSMAAVMGVEVGTVSATLAAAHSNVRKRLREAEAHA